MQTTDWCQNDIEFTDRTQAEDVAARDLGPLMAVAQDAGHLHGWWYIRKHPYWRLRYLPDDPAATAVSELLDKLAADGRILDWTRGIYEPETVAFGGAAAMDIAHELFHHDSRHLLARAGHTAPSDTPSLGRRETAVVLCSVLLRSAGLDWYEQGDVWAKVAQLRPAAPSAPASTAALAAAMRRLMTVDARVLCDPATSGPLTGHHQWVTAFEKAGQALADLMRHGRLCRGLRAVLAHHLIFHANRARLPATDQSALAALALETVFATTSGDSVSPADHTTTTTKVTE